MLPGPLETLPGLVLPFSWVHVRANRAYVSGHGAQEPDGSLATRLLGKVGETVSEEEAYEAARLTALAVLGNLKRELGDLDRVTAWLRVFGMVNSAPGFDQQPNVINGFSDLILQLYGPTPGTTRARPSAWRSCRSASALRSKPRSRSTGASRPPMPLRQQPRSPLRRRGGRVPAPLPPTP